MTATGLRPGEQLAADGTTVRVVVIRVPAGLQPSIACGGRPMSAVTGPPPPATGAVAPVTDGDPLLGKRYVDATGAVELLCTSPGTGELSCDDVAMTPKAAAALPASD
jgi:hypothetical protein